MIKDFGIWIRKKISLRFQTLLPIKF